MPEVFHYTTGPCEDVTRRVGLLDVLQAQMFCGAGDSPSPTERVAALESVTETSFWIGFCTRHNTFKRGD